MGQAYENIWSHTHTYIHTYIHTYKHTYTHTHIHIHTYNRNIWPSATPTANQYKHMAERPIIETYAHTIAGRRSFVTPGRFFCLRLNRPLTHYFDPIVCTSDIN